MQQKKVCGISSAQSYIYNFESTSHVQSITSFSFSLSLGTFQMRSFFPCAYKIILITYIYMRIENAF